METLHAMHTFSSKIDSVTITIGENSWNIPTLISDQCVMWTTILSQSVIHLWLNQLISFDNDNYICIDMNTLNNFRTGHKQLWESIYSVWEGWMSFSCLCKKAYTAWRKLWQPQLNCLIQLRHYFDWIFNSKKSKCWLLGLGEALSVCLSLPAGTAWLERQLGSTEHAR